MMSPSPLDAYGGTPRNVPHLGEGPPIVRATARVVTRGPLDPVGWG